MTVACSMRIRGNKLSFVGRDGVLRQLRLDAVFKRCSGDMIRMPLRGGPRAGTGAKVWWMGDFVGLD